MKNWDKVAILAVCIAITALPLWLAVTILPERRLSLTVNSVVDVINLFEKMGFDPQTSIQNDNPQFPRFFLRNLPRDLPVEPDPKKRKAVFVSIVLPHILDANEQIRLDRRRLQRLHKFIAMGRDLRWRDQQWLDELARTYRTSAGNTEELIKRVDIIPARLALAQAAQESGWGTSRFSQIGNALFGQHAPVGKGSMTAIRDAGVALKVFNNLQESVRDYMRNLNRHPAYRGFREIRADMRSQQNPLDDLKLVSSLSHYSEERRIYVDRLTVIMNLPEVRKANHAKLATKKIFYLSSSDER
ncbi:MAG: glucosaminidase domain-containing protein [Pseudomonadota bacterium]|nr:glucosaminidase domain-containing protein [Pseudomonadota bacterium]